jgi:hypothetical protein
VADLPTGIPNANLANSTVSYGGVTLSLGGSDATPAFNLTDATSLPIVAGTTGTLTEARGGTNQTTYATGDTLYASASNTLSKLSIGTNGQILTVSGGVPTWSTPSGGITSLNGLTLATQTFATPGTSGTSPAWVSSGSTHTLNIPNAGVGIARGLVTNGTQEFDGLKTFDDEVHTEKFFDTVGNSLTLNGYKINNMWALRYNAAAGENTIISNNSAFSTLTGTGNILMGRDSGRFLTTGSNNVAIGSVFTLASAVSGVTSNLALGVSSLQNLTSGSYNVALGQSSMRNLTSGSYNFCSGLDALLSMTSGSNTIAIGSNAGRLSTSASDSVFIGQNAGYGLATGNNNIAIGQLSMGWSGGLAGAANNVAIGYYALGMSNGNHSVALGYFSGFQKRGSYNVYLGSGAGQAAALTSEDNKIYIKCHSTNTLVSGDGATKQFSVDGRIRVAEGTGTATAGDIRYNTSTNKHQGYDGTSWNDMY